MARKALVVGIDYYETRMPLRGCVNDAYSVKGVLDRHSDGSVNFAVKLLVGTGPNAAVTRSDLKDRVKDLFATDCDVALLYFAGHGHVEATGGYLIASDSGRDDDGLALSEVLGLANKSRARNKIILLDSCHSGIAASSLHNQSVAELSDGMTILTASTSEQYASEEDGAGVFTALLVDALGGAAANLVGKITPGSVYAHIDQSLGEWDNQRPVFKTNVKEFVSLRNVQPTIGLQELQRIVEFFPAPGFEFALNPTFEPESAGRSADAPAPDPENTRTFAVLQKYNREGLLRPVDAPHMWHAAMNSKACKLTALGEHYRRLVAKGRI